MENIQDPAGIWTQDLLSTSQTLFTIKPLGPLAEEQQPKLHKQHCLEASAEFQLILTLSELDWTGTPGWTWIYFSLSKPINIIHERLLSPTINNIQPLY